MILHQNLQWRIGYFVDNTNNWYQEYYEIKSEPSNDEKVKDDWKKFVNERPHIVNQDKWTKFINEEDRVEMVLKWGNYLIKRNKLMDEIKLCMED
jgi:5'-deoxynucleotidase YfbR-like HD superfamily hydrolase